MFGSLEISARIKDISVETDTLEEKIKQLLLGLPNLPHEAPHHFGIYINRQNAIHWQWQEITDLGNYSAQVGDIDKDGDMDIVGLRNYNNPPIELWRNFSADRTREEEIPDTAQETAIGPDKILPDNILSLDKWTYIQVDNQRSRFAGRTSGDGYWFGLAMGDLTGNREMDIASGKWVYRNPGGQMDAKWERHEIGDSLDALLIMNVDNDEKGDLIAAKCNHQYWIEVMGMDWEREPAGLQPWNQHTGIQPGTDHSRGPAGDPPERRGGALPDHP